MNECRGRQAFGLGNCESSLDSICLGSKRKEGESNYEDWLTVKVPPGLPERLDEGKSELGR